MPFPGSIYVKSNISCQLPLNSWRPLYDLWCVKRFQTEPGQTPPLEVSTWRSDWPARPLRFHHDSWTKFQMSFPALCIQLLIPSWRPKGTQCSECLGRHVFASTLQLAWNNLGKVQRKVSLHCAPKQDLDSHHSSLWLLLMWSFQAQLTHAASHSNILFWLCFSLDDQKECSLPCLQLWPNDPLLGSMLFLLESN